MLGASLEAEAGEPKALAPLLGAVLASVLRLPQVPSEDRGEALGRHEARARVGGGESFEPLAMKFGDHPSEAGEVDEVPRDRLGAEPALDEGSPHRRDRVLPEEVPVDRGEFRTRDTHGRAIPSAAADRRASPPSGLQCAPIRRGSREGTGPR